MTNAEINMQRHKNIWVWAKQNNGKGTKEPPRITPARNVALRCEWTRRTQKERKITAKEFLNYRREKQICRKKILSNEREFRRDKETGNISPPKSKKEKLLQLLGSEKLCVLISSANEKIRGSERSSWRLFIVGSRRALLRRVWAFGFVCYFRFELRLGPT